MKTCALPIHSKTRTNRNQRRTHRSQPTQTVPSKRGKEAKKLTESALVVQHLHKIVTSFPQTPSILQGKVRRLKIEPHYRESRAIIWGQSKPVTTTCKIRLTGNWIAQAGFTEHERIQVIPMQRMLIIIPE